MSKADIYIIFGAQAVGKSRFLEQIEAKPVGRLLECWDGREALQPGDVAITNMDPPPVVEGAIYIEVKRPPSPLLVVGERGPELSAA